MAHRILHQISSNVPKSSILKGHISRSTSPQREKSVTRNLVHLRPKSVSIDRTSQHLSDGSPTILQWINNQSFIESRKRFLSDKNDAQDEEEAHVDSVEENVQENVKENASDSFDDNYLKRFEKFLNDSDYPEQSAKEFPINKQSQSINARPPGLKLNEDIIKVLRRRTETRNINRDIDIEEVNHQANIKYQTALRRMHKIGQKINTDLYKIDTEPNFVTFINKESFKNSDMLLYQHTTKNLQPSNMFPIGYIDNSTESEKYKSMKLISKPRMKFPGFKKLNAPVRKNKSNTGSINKNSSMQYHSLEQRTESDNFTDQMKILEPNYEPQKRYKHPNKNDDRIYHIKETGDFRSNSFKHLKTCQSIINQLKDLNPDYVAPSLNKKKYTDVELINSTANIIKDYQRAVNSYGVDTLNDTLCNKIKVHRAKCAPQKRLQTKIKSSPAPIKIRVGSKLNLQQSFVSSNSPNLTDSKASPNEKILVPWPSLSERRKYDMLNSSTYTDLNKNTTTFHIPINKIAAKDDNLNLLNASKKTAEIFLPNNRAFSTKTQMKPNVFNVDEMKKIDKIPSYSRKESPASIASQNHIYHANKAKFELKNMESSKPISKTIAASKLTSNLKVWGKEGIKAAQSKCTTQTTNLSSENLTLFKKTKYIPRTKAVSACPKRNIEEKHSSSTPINTNKEQVNLSTHSKSNILHLSQSFQDKLMKPTSVCPIGNKITTANLKLPPQKLDKNILKTQSKLTSSKSPSSDRLKQNNAKLIKTNDLLNIKLDKMSNSTLIAKKNNCVNKKLNLNLQDTDITKTLQQEANRLVTKYLNRKTNNEQSPIIPVREDKKVSVKSKLNSHSAVNLKESSSNTKNIDSNNIIRSNGILDGKQNIATKIIPIKSTSQADDSLLSTEIENSCIVSKKNYFPDTTEESTKRSLVNLLSKPSGKVYNSTVGKSDKLLLSISTNNLVKRKYNNIASTIFPMRDITVMKNNFAPFYRPYCSKYEYTPPGTKRVHLKRLKKRPGFDEEFPPTSDWKSLKQCKTICQIMANVRMDKKLKYEEKLKTKKLPLLKRSNCPCIENIEINSSIAGTVTKGPALRKGYVFYEGRSCKLPFCEVTRPFRADVKAGVEVKKKKLPVIYPRTRKFHTFTDSKLLSEDNCTSINSNKSMHTTISSIRQCLKNSNKLPEQVSEQFKSNKLIYTNLQNNISKNQKCCPKYTTAQKLLNTKGAFSPYISYSDYKISKTQLEPPLSDSDKTPDYLQPNCSMPIPSGTVTLEPPLYKNININVRHEENFTKIPKPIIKDFNKLASITAPEIKYKSNQVEDSYKPAAKIRSYSTFPLKTMPLSSSTVKIKSKSAFKNMNSSKQADEEKKIYTSIENQVKLVKEDLLNSSFNEYLVQNLKTSLKHLAIELPSSTVETKYNNCIRNVCKQTDNTLLENDNSKTEMNFVTKVSSEPRSKAIIPCDVSLHKDCNNTQVPSLWVRISSYIMAKLDYTNVQEKKMETDLLLCSGDENDKVNAEDTNKFQLNSSNDIDDNHMVQDAEAENSKSSLKHMYENYDSVSPDSTNRFHMFSEDYKTFLQTVKRESKTRIINNYEFERKLLKTHTKDNSKLLTNRRTFDTFSFQSRAYSTRSPKTPNDLLKYFNKIQNEKTSNIDEDELTNNILTAIKVGMEVIKKSKLPQFNDSYFDLFKQLDTISKVELQSIQCSKDDRYDAFSWPTEDTANFRDKKNIQLANTTQQFCRNGSDIQNFTVLDYEESERKKTNDLKQILEEILKRNAEA